MTPHGHYQFKRMLFGLVNATATFNRLMEKCLKNYSEFCQFFVDDIIIFSKNVQDHCTHLNIVLKSLKEAGLTLKPAKVNIGCETIEFLGFKIGSGLVKPLEKKLEITKQYILKWYNCFE